MEGEPARRRARLLTGECHQAWASSAPPSAAAGLTERQGAWRTGGRAQALHTSDPGAFRPGMGKPTGDGSGPENRRAARAALGVRLSLHPLRGTDSAGDEAVRIKR